MGNTQRTVQMIADLLINFGIKSSIRHLLAQLVFIWHSQNPHRTRIWCNG